MGAPKESCHEEESINEKLKNEREMWESGDNLVTQSCAWEEHGRFEIIILFTNRFIITYYC